MTGWRWSDGGPGHYRDAFARHPGAIPALVGQAVSDPTVASLNARALSRALTPMVIISAGSESAMWVEDVHVLPHGC
jgi:hypothetical protein